LFGKDAQKLKIHDS